MKRQFNNNTVFLKRGVDSYARGIFVLIWILGGLLTSVSNAQAQSVWGLEDVLLKAEEQSIFKYQAEADNKIAQSRWKFYQTRLNPGISLEFLAPNFIKTSREIIQPDGSIAFQSVSQNNSSLNLGISQQVKATGGSIFLSTQLQRFDDFSLDRKQYNGVPFRIGVFQPLFGFNELKWASKIEPLLLQEADRGFIIEMEDIHLRATIVFFDLLFAQLEESIATNNTEVNQTLLEIAQARYDLGKISRNELLQLELEYKAAVKNLSAAQFQVEFARGALQTFLGGDKSSDVRLANPSPKESEINIAPGIALQKARENRPEIIAFDRLRKEADRDINQAATDYGIQANISASFGLARGSANFSDIYTDPISEQQVQLSVRIPIVDWGRKKSAVGIAKANKELIDQQIAQEQLDFENDILQSIGGWEQLQREVRMQQEIRDVSLTRFEISRQRYVLGDISITDLTIAQREKDQSQRDYINALRSYWISFYQIRKLTGYDFENDMAIQYYIN